MPSQARPGEAPGLSSAKWLLAPGAGRRKEGGREGGKETEREKEREREREQERVDTGGD